MSKLGDLTKPKVEQLGPPDSGEFVYVDISSVDNQSKRIVEPKRLGVDAAPSRARQRLKAGDVLVSMTRPNLNAVAIVPTDLDGSVGSTGFHVLRANERALPHWLYYGVQSRRFVEAMSGLVQGALYPAVRPRDIQAFELPVPDVSAQRRIVAEIDKQFSRLDEAVGNLQRVKANLKRYKGAVLQSVTSGQLEAQGRSSPERGEPAGWRRLTIEELASSEPRSIQSGPFGSNLLHSEFQATGKLVIGIDNVQDGAFSMGANHRISEIKFVELEKYQARPKDVLITVMATVGRVCVVPENIEPAIITKHVYRITVDRAVALPEYVGIALRGASEVRSQLLASVQGQTRPGLNGQLIKRIRVPIPPLAEQHRIVAEVDRRLSIVHEVEAQLDANLKRAKRLRQAVLDRAFGIPNNEVARAAVPNLSSGDEYMPRRTLPQMPPPRVSDADDERLDLLTVLRRFPAGVAAEQLLIEAKYRGDQVDQFYRDLAKLRDAIEVTVPTQSRKTWPYGQAATVRLRGKSHDAN